MQLSLGLLDSQLDGGKSAPLSSLHGEAEHMAELLNELLLFSRAEASSVRTNPQRVALLGVATTAVQREHSEQRVSIDIAADMQVIAYPQLLLRALSNLVRNARRYAEEAANPIEITAAIVGTAVQVVVRDRGPGVPEADLVKLGEPFFRPEPSRSRDTGGFGLGLAIVRRCIAACGGEVRFRNREGGGFEAEIRLEAAV
jgi:two-component system sensor histidine kinase CpxA